MATRQGPLSSTNPQQEADREGSSGCKGLAALLRSFLWAFLQESTKYCIASQLESMTSYFKE